MSRYDTDNYLFHFRKDTAAQRDILHTAEHRGACFKYICNVLNVKPLLKLYISYVPRRMKPTGIMGITAPAMVLQKRPINIRCVP